MLVLLDLDGTLVDRDAAFARWATAFVAETGRAETCAGELAWLLDADAGGYTPRRELAERVVRRFGLSTPLDDVVERLQLEVVAGIACFPGVLEALDRLRSAGAALGVVTNGESAQQRAKLARTGLADRVDGVVVSAEVGVRKPAPDVFALGRAIAPQETTVWMVGDHPRADVAGARAVGLRTGWVSHGRPWTEPWLPTVTARTTAEVLDQL